MDIVLNGVKITTGAVTLTELIAEQGVETMGLAIAIGARVIRRNTWETTPIADGAEITLIRATQGG